ncbi:MAG: DUF559 domain-containing protein [Rhodoglobus sp.]
MTSAIEAIHRLGGVARTATLLRAGATEGSIRSAVRSGRLLRIRKGWFCEADAAPAVVGAVGLGGRLACISAALHLGLWTPESDPAVHVALPRHAGHRPDETNGVVHWQSSAWRARDSPVESITAVIRQVLLCCEREVAITIIDSALNSRRVTLSALRRIVHGLPKRFGSVLGQIDGKSESGLESLCRVRLARLGLRIRSQVRIAGVGRVDLVIGDRLVIEADGREHHDSPDAFRRDRARDLALTRLGYVVIRLSYQQIVDEWQRVELTVAGLVARREHEWSSAHRRAGLAANDG